MPKRKDTDFGLKFLHQVLGLPALHVGLFTEGMKPDLAGVKAAQIEYSRAVAALVPENAATVLDVGCGFGNTSRIIKEAGHAVEGLSPDAYHGEQYHLVCGEGTPFHHTGFETFEPNRTYDCLLFGESSSYIRKDTFFPKCIEITKPGSYLVGADFFKISPNEAFASSWVQEDFVTRAESAGFTREYYREITREILPTFAVANMFLGYGRRLHSYVRDAARRSWPFLWRLANIIYRRRLAYVDQLLHVRLPQQLDAEAFPKSMCYAMYRFKRSTA